MNRMMEELSMNAWPALRTDHYDGWVLRYANNYTKRANSIYPLYEGHLLYEEKIAYCEAYYKQHQMPTTFKLHDDESLHALDIYLEDHGYHVVDPTDMMVLDLENYVDEVSFEYRVSEGYGDEAARELASTLGVVSDSERDQLVRTTMSTMMAHISPECFYLFIEEDGEVIATGNGVVEQAYVGVFNIGVKEAYRGRGYGKKIMQAIIKEGLIRGANKSYLQVICKNEVALDLYASMGYKKVYRYWYRRKNY